MAPLGVALHGCRRRDAFALGLAFATAGWIAGAWWLVPALAAASATPPAIALVLGLGIGLVQALPYGVAALVCATLGWSGNARGALTAALAWTAIVGLGPQIFPGNLALSQYLSARAIQIADIGGVPLVFLALHAAGFLVAAAVVAWCDGRRDSAWRCALLAVTVVAAVHGYGTYRLAQAHDPLAPTLRVGLVQPNVPLRGREPAHSAQALHALERLSRALAAGGRAAELPELIVWPEVPPRLSYSGDAAQRRVIDAVVEATGAAVLVAGVQPERGTGDAHNALELVSAEGAVGTYHKRRLVPFGEYLPGADRLPWLRALMPGAVRFRAGTRPPVLRLPDGPRIVPLVCFEAAFPELAAEGVRRGGGVLVNAVNDAWFGRSRGAEVHLALALFRAVELRTALVRVANSGVSAVISPAGEIVRGSRIGLLEAGATVQRVPVAPLAATVYGRVGDWITPGSAVLALLLGLRRGRRVRVR